MWRKRDIWTVAVVGLLVLGGCKSAAQHGEETRRGLEGDRLTVGTVQRQIKVGMSGAEVAQVLGSPNVVTTDEKRREVWVYDKISTQRVESNTTGGVAFLTFIISSAGSTSTSQRTLTVIVKFDEDKKVRDFAYHTARF
jgi:outer membrane protein assembly factor BamE (lipoprotein component of BamABCDE complex)